jgi:hypothetical protein
VANQHPALDQAGSERHPRCAFALRRLLGGWRVPAGIGALLLIGLAAWVMPLPVEKAVTDPVTGKPRVVTTWDTSRFQAVAAFWRPALLLAVGFAAVVGVKWWGRGWVVAKASAARFFAASLLFHSLLVLSLGAVPLARAVVEHAEVIRVQQAAGFLDNPKAGAAEGRAAYEKVADPREENVATPPPARQAPVTQAPDSGDAPAPTMPPHAVRRLPPERLMFVPPRLPEAVRRPLEIRRRSDVGVAKPVEIALDIPALPPPEATPKEKPIEGRPVHVARREQAAPLAGGPERLDLPAPKKPRATSPRPEAMELPSVRAPEPALPRRRLPRRLALAEVREAKPEIKAEAAPADGPPGGARVALPRLAPPAMPAGRPDEPVRPPPTLKQPIRVGAPSPAPLAAKPDLGSAADRLPRMGARADRTARIEEKVVAAPLAQREKAERRKSVAMYGGTKASEATVERGLDWLAAHQNANGSWGLQNFHANCRHPKCSDPGTATSDPAGTGIALLPFLGAAHTDKAGKHKQTVARALHWLVTQQRPDGTWPAPGDARPMYGHAMAAIALCEAYGMTRNAKLRGPAQKALDYIVKAQHAGTGGWRYLPNQPADTSVVGWQMMALKSGEMAGLSVPAKTFDGIKRWLASVEANRPTGGMFGYQQANPTPAMTAQGLLCLQYLGARREAPRIRAGTDYLLRNLPRAGAETSYYWYHANQVMFHMQGKHWKAWNDKLRDLLVSTQETNGAPAGSWKPTDHREKPGGRVYATALRVLMLEVYYRHLPLYQQLEK